MSRRARRRVRAAALAAALGLALLAPGWGYVPPPERVARAAARANGAAQRTRPLALEIAIGAPEASDGAEPLATGTLLADPSGRARLEVVHRAGFRERHLLRGVGERAARDGEPLEEPAPLLPPLAPLQAASGDALLGWLRGAGAPPVAELGFDGRHDCVVLGGRRDGASVWVDHETWEIVRVDVPEGTRFHFGPMRAFGEGLRLPAWIDVESPSRPTLRLEVRAARAARPTPADFDPAWLAQAPPPPPPAPAPPAPAPPPSRAR